jgi:hypothetical protein
MKLKSHHPQTNKESFFPPQTAAADDAVLCWCQPQKQPINHHHERKKVDPDHRPKGEKCNNFQSAEGPSQ